MLNLRFNGNKIVVFVIIGVHTKVFAKAVCRSVELPFVEP